MVFVAKSLDNGSKVAIKQMDLAQQPRKELIVNEIVVMKESHHPNVVNFIEAFLIKNTELWVVMEFMEGGALTDVIENNKLEEDQIAGISFEVQSDSPLFYETLLLINWLMVRASFVFRPAKDYSIFTSETSFIETSRATTSCSTSWAKSRSVRSSVQSISFDPNDALLTLMPFCYSRLWVLRQTLCREVEASDDGRDAVLDGSGGRQTEGVRRQGRHLVARHHGHRDDRERASLPGRGTAQGALPHRDERNPDAQKARIPQRRAQELPFGLPLRRRQVPGDCCRASTSEDLHSSRARILSSELTHSSVAR
jgi:hypothetical protein